MKGPFVYSRKVMIFLIPWHINSIGDWDLGNVAICSAMFLLSPELPSVFPYYFYSLYYLCVPTTTWVQCARKSRSVVGPWYAPAACPISVPCLIASTYSWSVLTIRANQSSNHSWSFANCRTTIYELVSAPFYLDWFVQKFKRWLVIMECRLVQKIAAIKKIQQLKSPKRPGAREL